MTDQAAKLARLHDFILPLLRCPGCRAGGLAAIPSAVECRRCRRRFPIVNGAPVMLDDPEAATRYDPAAVLSSKYTDQWLECIANAKGEPVLDLGSGNNPDTRPNVVRMEIYAIEHVDVVGTAEKMPFRDGVFGAVMSGAVFEHIAGMWTAADEVFRIVKTGGEVYVETAFLQPVHAYPSHYFNMTLQGAEFLFRRFEKVDSGVRRWQYPSFALHWILANWSGHLAEPHREAFLKATIGEVIDEYSKNEFSARWMEDFTPAQVQELAAGVYFRGRKPAPTDTRGISSPILPSSGGRGRTTLRSFAERVWRRVQRLGAQR